jgi:hypothetical protein
MAGGGLSRDEARLGPPSWRWRRAGRTGDWPQLAALPARWSSLPLLPTSCRPGVPRDLRQRARHVVTIIACPSPQRAAVYTSGYLAFVRDGVLFAHRVCPAPVTCRSPVTEAINNETEVATLRDAIKTSIVIIACVSFAEAWCWPQGHSNPRTRHGCRDVNMFVYVVARTRLGGSTSRCVDPIEFSFAPTESRQPSNGRAAIEHVCCLLGLLIQVASG